MKTRVENVRFLSWRIFFVGKNGIQSTNEMAFKRTVILRASFRFPTIRFDAPTLLSFSGFTHAHAKCPPVMCAKYSLPPFDWLKLSHGHTTWSQGNLHYMRLHFLKLDREFFCLQPSLARLYSAAASPSERLRSDGSLAIINSSLNIIKIT